MLNKKDILKYFEAINDRLYEQNKFGELIIAGGAAMTLIYNARESTQDIDAIFNPKDELRNIIRSVGIENGLDADWLNDGVKGFFTDKMTASLYKQYSNLTVRSVDPECLLAMKLTSARLDTNDMSDSLVLMNHLNFKDIDALYDVIEKYAHKNQLTAKAKYFTIMVHEKYANDINSENKN